MYHFSAVCPEFQMKKYGETLEKCGISSVFEADPSNLDARCILAMLMHVIQGERFCDGYLAKALESGHVQSWLRRLEELE